MTDLAKVRLQYAEELRKLLNLESEALVTAFASVPREHYLGVGPWRRLTGFGPGDPYETTPDDDPRHLYQNALFAIDEERRLNNGQPSGLASWFDALTLRAGERVLHVGCGVGYYTAILAEVVGAEGQVTGLEVDSGLAVRAAQNLRHYPHVEVLYEDGSAFDTGPRDAIFINAGATHVVPLWLMSLREGGRLLVPLTVALDASGLGGGHMLRVYRRGDDFEARFVSPVGIFPCSGARDGTANQRLSEAYQSGDHARVCRVRCDDHAVSESCWLHEEQTCLSMAT